MANATTILKYMQYNYAIHIHVYPSSYSFTLEQVTTYKAKTTLKPQLTPKQLKALKLHCVVSLTVMPEGSVKCTKRLRYMYCQCL